MAQLKAEAMNLGGRQVAEIISRPANRASWEETAYTAGELTCSEPPCAYVLTTVFWVGDVRVGLCRQNNL
jgi:hypothetical protein